jgi:hypothetical protein
MVNYKKIIFRSFRPHTNITSKSKPSNTHESTPSWYKEADRFAINPQSGEYYKANKNICPFPKDGTSDDYGKVPTWKACPAIMDAFSTGYVLRTPCDIKFFKNKNGKIDVEVLDKRYSDFCTKRQPMPQFIHPKGYYEDHFAWYPDWGIELPDGYSCLYMTPMNRFDLPFLNTSGIVDNDKVYISGTFPFFIVDGWEGIVEAGTPYMQIIPFQRENWKSDFEILNQKEIYDRMKENMLFYRIPDGGSYVKNIWTRREYK